MGCQAALRCLAHAGRRQAAVDLIIVACATPDQSQPAVACMVQEKLGIAEGQCPAFDVNSVCAGFVFALNVAQGMMLTEPERYRNVLVIGTDAFSKILNWKDRRTCVFFGDGAGRGAADPDRERRRSASTSTWAATGAGAEFIEVPGRRHAPARQPRRCIEQAAEQVRDERPQGLGVRGEHRARRRSARCWASTASSPRDLDLLILHQSNLRMLEAIMKSLELPMEQDGHDRRDLRQHRGGQHPADAAEGLGGRAAAAGRARDAVRVRRRAVVGRGALRLVAESGGATCAAS